MKRPNFASIVLCLFAATACKGREAPPAPAPASSAPSSGAPGAASAPVPGSAGGTTQSATERVASRCTNPQRVTSGNLSEVGGALYLAYQAALKGNTPDAFAEFVQAFTPDADREHLKGQVFPRVVEHVGKYVAGPSDPSFTLCRVEKQTPERVKVFVQSNDTRKSDPPSLLVLRDGRWLIDTMTP